MRVSVLFFFEQANTIKWIAMGAAFMFMFWRISNIGATGWIRAWFVQLVSGPTHSDGGADCVEYDEFGDPEYDGFGDPDEEYWAFN